MKQLIILCSIGTALLAACNSTPNTRTFIPGTYVNQAGGEYSVADDTLVIEASEGNNYLIHRKTGFNLIRDGKKGKREYETEEWRALYNQSTKSLTEISRGRLLTVYPEAKKLLVGKREYQKVSQ